MHPDTHQLAGHMQRLGLSMLGHAIHHSVFADFRNPYYSAIGVLHAAQAAEIILKACIAEEHPLLIFSKLPRPDDDGSRLMLDLLLTRGKTLQYSELPDILWATTGYRIPAMKVYRDFGDLRNTIQHLAVPSEDLPKRSLEFLIEVVDRLIQEFWATNVFHHIEDDDGDEYFIEALETHGISYAGWVPESRTSLSPSHPLWLFSPWRHTISQERIWVDDHSGGKLTIIYDADYQTAVQTRVIPITSVVNDWRAFIPETRA